MTEKTRDIEEIAASRRIARRMMNEAASKGDALAGMAEALEHLAEPFYLGDEYNDDASDLEVWP